MKTAEQWIDKWLDDPGTSASDRLQEALLEARKEGSESQWIDIGTPPKKGGRVLICDEGGFVDIETVEDCINQHRGKQTWLESYQYGNGREIVAWMPLPKFPEQFCRDDADGSMP
jgi:hypothetical protein